MYFQRQSDLCFTHNAVGIGVISEKKHFDLSLVARGLVSQNCQIGLSKFYQNFKKATSNTVKFILDLGTIFRWRVGRLGGGT